MANNYSTKCIAIYFKKSDNDHEYVTDLSCYSYIFRNSLEKFIIASAKELIDRIDNKAGNMNIDFQPDINYDKSIIVVGTKSESNICLIYGLNVDYNHHILISLSKKIIKDGLKKTIAENFNYLKPQDIQICNIMNDLDETKNIMIDNIDKLLERGENLETLVERTKYLSDDSKQFYKRAKKLNSCCIII